MWQAALWLDLQAEIWTSKDTVFPEDLLSQGSSWLPPDLMALLPRANRHLALSPLPLYCPVLFLLLLQLTAISSCHSAFSQAPRPICLPVFLHGPQPLSSYQELSLGLPSLSELKFGTTKDHQNPTGLARTAGGVSLVPYKLEKDRLLCTR